MIYDEVKRVNKRLSFIEDNIEEVIIKGLPEASLSKAKKEETRRSVEEMKDGEFVTLEDIKIA